MRIALCVALLTAGAVWAGDEGVPASSAPRISYPLDGTVFPPDLAPPIVRWAGGAAARWQVTIEFADGGPAETCDVAATTWQPEPVTWARIKQRSQERDARLCVRATGEATPAATLTFRTSRDPVGAPIFYREVNLPFIEAVKDPSTIRWRCGPVSATTAPPIVLDKLPVCGNCHSFSADGGVLGLDVDYANDKGSYALAPVAAETVLSRDRIITWSDFRRDDGELTFGLLSAVSPDGRYVVSTVKDRSVFVPKPDLMYSQLFFPIRGILAVHDRQTGEYAALPGADDPAFVQSNPTWSPDGRYIVFARAPAYRLRQDAGNVLLTQAECAEFLSEGKPFRYDLYRVPFNGGAGGPAEPLPGAAQNGLSNFFAKYSPDGRWIVFCQARSYMLLQPDSALYIMPAAGGAPRRLRANTGRMNSWHSWSPNGRWLVFSSKLNGPYTQLLLTHIDEAGESTPPVVLEHFTAADRAANIPEFVNIAADGLRVVRERFIDDSHYVRAGDGHLAADNDVPGAVACYRKALELNPDNAVAHSNLGGLLAVQGVVDEAVEHLHAALRLDPASGSAHYNLGMLMERLGRPDEAIGHLAAAVRLKPDVAGAHRVLGALLCARGMALEGVPHLNRAVELAPDDPVAHYCLGQAMVAQGMLQRAVGPLTRAVEIKPDYADAQRALGQVLYQQGRAAEALRHLEAAVDTAPGDVGCVGDLAWILATGPAEVRDPARAIEFARRACALAGPQAIAPWDTLGVAYAAAGRFDEAAEAAEQALRRADVAGEGEMVRRIRERIAMYRRGEAFRP